MLRPKIVNENIDNFNDVAKDALERMTAVRGSHGKEGEIPDLENELFKWSTECGYFFILYCIILYYIILYYIVLYCIVLYYIIVVVVVVILLIG